MSVLIKANNWNEIKAFISDRQASLNYHEKSKTYDIVAMDSVFTYSYEIEKDATDTTELDDFVSNFKNQNTTNSIKPLDPRDSDGSKLNRIKSTRTGWMYQLHSVEFTTGKLNSVYNKDVNGVDLEFATLKLYDVNDVEITVEADEGNAVKTVLAWEAKHDLEVLGGYYFQSAPPLFDCRMYVVAVPDVPAPWGSKDFITGGLNLKHIPAGTVVDVDGKSAKFLQYNPLAPLTKFEITLIHGVGCNHTGNMAFKIFKE
jgi:hypothetical protein